MRGRKSSSHFSYANVMSTLAVVLALTGGATAIALSLPKNSVKSKQIAKGAVKTSDLGKDAATGAKVKESDLAKVPSAARADTAGRADSAAVADSAATANSVGSVSAGNIAKAQAVSSNFFTSTLDMTVSGFGTYYLRCETNESSALTDDEVTFGYSSSGSLPANAIEGGLNSSAGFPLDTPVTRVIGGDAGGSGTFTNEDDRVFYSYRVAIPGTNRALVIDASGFDDESNSGCAGQIQAFVIG